MGNFHKSNNGWIRDGIRFLLVLLVCVAVAGMSVPVYAAEEIVSDTETEVTETVLNEYEESENPVTEESDQIIETDASEADKEQQPEVNQDVPEETTKVVDIDTAEMQEEVTTDENAGLSVSSLENGEEEEEPVEADVYASRSESLPSGNNIYFYNIEGDAKNADMILLESNGRWGLIDAGHRYEKTITDENGTSYRTDVSDLSCQDAGKNGYDAMKYLVATLGVDHLDFIIGTHAHSDHVGGIPEIAGLMVGSEDGTVHSLIDENTVYFYKSYQHTGIQDDDLGPKTTQYSWHNQAFYYQAKQAVSEKGGKLVDVSCGICAKEGKSIWADQSQNVSLIQSTGLLSGVSYQSRSSSNPYDDRISFQWEGMQIDLYHLFSVDGALNENVNSIATVITSGGHKVYLAGDMDTQFQTEQKIAKVIHTDHGHFDIVKMSHHGCVNGSNSRAFIDYLQPQIMISTNCWTDLSKPSESGGYSSVKYYASKNYGTVIYGTGASDRMLAVNLDQNDVSVHNVKGAGTSATLASANSCKDSGRIMDGWSQWNVEYITDSIVEWFYFVNNKAVTGWKQINGKWYYFDTNGIMIADQRIKPGSYTYYLKSNGVMASDEWIKDDNGWSWADDKGHIVANEWIWTGNQWYYIKSNSYMASSEWIRYGTYWYWMDASGRITRDKIVQAGGVKYYLKSNGYMAANEWVYYSNQWYWANSSGSLAVDQWIWTGNAWYYMKFNGVMAANEWVKSGSYWYWMNASGSMASNQWVWTGSAWYYMKSNGVMAANEWIKSGSYWYWMNASGSMASSQWIWTGGAWYYMKSNGIMASREWIEDGNNWYWMGRSGNLLVTQAK